MNHSTTIRVVAAVIEHDGHYLITQRRPNAVLPLLWEFPGGKVEEIFRTGFLTRGPYHSHPLR